MVERDISFSSAQNRMTMNLMAFCQNPDKFFYDIAMQTSLSKYVRWFGNGDMPNEGIPCWYVQGSSKNHETKYLAFTKQYGCGIVIFLKAIRFLLI